MKATLNELKHLELNKDMQRKLIGGATVVPDTDDKVNGVTVFRRELLD
jgi:hypothetical protein